MSMQFFGKVFISVVCILNMLQGAQGEIDTSFGEFKVITPGPYDNDGALPRRIVLQDDGKIVAVSREGGSSDDFVVTRYLGDGSLDASFGVQGVVRTDFDGEDDESRSVVMHNGKIIVAGTTNFKVALARYNSDGSLDTTFNTTGKVSEAIGTSSVGILAVAVQNDGHIVTVGYHSDETPGNSVIIVRHTETGILDSTFDEEGIRIIDIPGFGRSVAIQSDGKIIIGANDSSTGTIAVIRLNANGSYDESFGSNGVTHIDSGGDNFIYSISVQEDGKIIAAGECISGNGFSLFRLLSNGALDTSFNSSGIVTTKLGTGSSRALDVALQGDGKIVATGIYYNNGKYVFTALRYNSDGSLDPQFSNNGIVTTLLGNSSESDSIVVQKDGKIVVGGGVGGGNFGLVRYNSDGTLDTNGKMTTAIGSTDDTARSIVSHPDGRVIVVGESFNGERYNFALAGYKADGTPYLDICRETVTTNIGGTYQMDDYAKDVAIDNNKSIVVAGYSYNLHDDAVSVARYLANGTLDTSFMNDGTINLYTNSSDDRANSVVIQSDNKIVVAGYRDDGSRKSYLLHRFNEDGTLDETFGLTNGTITTDIENNDYAMDIAIQKNGYILAVGYSERGAYNQKVFSLARYKTNGTLDTSFGNNGTVLTAIESDGDNLGKSIAIQPDGKFVVVGCSTDFLNNNFTAVRYNSDGTLDTTFGGNGKVKTYIGSDGSCAEDVTILSDRKILVTGYSYLSTRKVFTVVRYNPDGSLDTTFDGDGKAVTAVGSGDGIAYGGAVLNDGSIIAAGYAQNGSTKDFALVKYHGGAPAAGSINVVMPAIYYLLMN